MYSNYQEADQMSGHQNQEREFYPSVENPKSSTGTKKKRRFSLWEPINEWIEQGKTLQCRRCGNIRTRMEFVQSMSFSTDNGGTMWHSPQKTVLCENCGNTWAYHRR